MLKEKWVLALIKIRENFKNARWQKNNVSTFIIIRIIRKGNNWSISSHSRLNKRKNLQNAQLNCKLNIFESSQSTAKLLINKWRNKEL